MAFSSKTTYQGKVVNAGTRAILDAANKMLATKEFGSEKGPLTLVQGSYSGGVAASAGTHNGGGAIDITAHNYKNRVKVFRLLGVAMWYRPTIRGLWSAHLHGIVCGDASVSSGGKAQVTEYYNKQDGLAGSGRDKDWRPYRTPILFKYKGSLKTRYAKKSDVFRSQPYGAATAKSKFSKGQAVTPVAVVRNAYGNLWFVTAHGNWGAEDDFTTTKPAAPKPVPPVVKPTPTPTAKSFNLTAVTQNVIYKRMANYGVRCGLMADSFSKSTSIVATQEAGGLGQAETFSKALEKSIGGQWDHHLWGDGFDISQGIHFREDVYTDKGTGMIKFLPASVGTSHNVVSWVKLQHKKTLIEFYVASIHAEYRGGLTYDKAREKQMLDAIPKMEKVAGTLPILWLGDFNSYLEKEYDGTGKAFTKHKYIDVESTPCAAANTEFDSYNGQEVVARKRKRQLDRCFYKVGGKIKAVKRTVITRMATFSKTKYKTPFASDHNGVEFELVISR